MWRIPDVLILVLMEKAMAPHSSTLAWKIPWTEEPGGLQSVGSLESDTTERLHFHFSLSCIGEGNGNPLQCSCLENPREGEAWWAAVHRVAQSRTWLKQLSSGSSSSINGFESYPFWYDFYAFLAGVSCTDFFTGAFSSVSSSSKLFSSLSTLSSSAANHLQIGYAVVWLESSWLFLVCFQIVSVCSHFFEFNSQNCDSLCHGYSLVIIQLTSSTWWGFQCL